MRGSRWHRCSIFAAICRCCRLAAELQGLLAEGLWLLTTSSCNAGKAVAGGFGQRGQRRVNARTACAATTTRQWIFGMVNATGAGMMPSLRAC